MICFQVFSYLVIDNSRTGAFFFIFSYLFFWLKKVTNHFQFILRQGFLLLSFLCNRFWSLKRESFKKLLHLSIRMRFRGDKILKKVLLVLSQVSSVGVIGVFELTLFRLFARNSRVAGIKKVRRARKTFMTDAHNLIRFLVWRRLNGLSWSAFVIDVWERAFFRLKLVLMKLLLFSGRYCQTVIYQTDAHVIAIFESWFFLHYIY